MFHDLIHSFLECTVFSNVNKNQKALKCPTSRFALLGVAEKRRREREQNTSFVIRCDVPVVDSHVVTFLPEALLFAGE